MYNVLSPWPTFFILIIRNAPSYHSFIRLHADQNMLLFTCTSHPFRLLRSPVLSSNQYNMRRLIPMRSLMNQNESFREQPQTRMQRKPLPNKERGQLHKRESDETVVFLSMASFGQKRRLKRRADPSFMFPHRICKCMPPGVYRDSSHSENGFQLQRMTHRKRFHTTGL